jgi:hypothetical protein
VHLPHLYESDQPSNQCIQRAKQTDPCHFGFRHAACTVPKLYELILKLVKQMQSWEDTSIKKIVQVLAAEGIKISITADMWRAASESFMPCPNFKTPAKDLTYKDLLTSIFNQSDHGQGYQNLARSGNVP